MVVSSLINRKKTHDAFTLLSCLLSQGNRGPWHPQKNPISVFRGTKKFSTVASANCSVSAEVVQEESQHLYTLLHIQVSHFHYGHVCISVWHLPW